MGWVGPRDDGSAVAFAFETAGFSQSEHSFFPIDEWVVCFCCFYEQSEMHGHSFVFAEFWRII